MDTGSCATTTAEAATVVATSAVIRLRPIVRPLRLLAGWDKNQPGREWDGLVLGCATGATRQAGTGMIRPRAGPPEGGGL
ncbi:hypothetical protein Aglo01_66370 [Actinokineospora globicatena]|nr:hypothetical protein Aglo01_66370 [Actinokineospora globicatena]GLW88949.1 hypothetical protein Aglo02_65880 [Actinokineospora globicatena]